MRLADATGSPQKQRKSMASFKGILRAQNLDCRLGVDGRKAKELLPHMCQAEHRKKVGAFACTARACDQDPRLAGLPPALQLRSGLVAVDLWEVVLHEAPEGFASTGAVLLISAHSVREHEVLHRHAAGISEDHWQQHGLEGQQRLELGLRDIQATEARMLAVGVRHVLPSSGKGLAAAVVGVVCLHKPDLVRPQHLQLKVLQAQLHRRL
mmetsp:Transcript_7653/g.18327  ORF Transcript_7653/g.18327 Transcript_7653/m.18327 type:complete len:210 (+) Transcript_7653:839-1468(+)